ncbi:MAG: polyprenyl synthetase family protein [Clostridiales bacterium]|nr:polyprenyl synthetase family protein [Clostridiales bacterium]
MNTLKEYGKITEDRLLKIIPELPKNAFEIGRMPALLSESMRYSLLAGGKRLRPAMLLASCEMLGGDVSLALDFACAIEMIHTYSLIHDDLPGMDDDDMRRGKPTNHVVFGVGQAILAGDGLLNMAFEVMLQKALTAGSDMEKCVLAANEIARAAGVTGMIAGQCADLYQEGRADGTEEMLRYIHEGKTMAMFVGAMRAGAFLAGADEQALHAITEYARAFGLLFQASDDVLDITADPALFGHSVGKDERDGKLTAVSVLTLEGAKARVEALLQEAVDALKDFGAQADFFRSLADAVAHRDH